MNRKLSILVVLVFFAASLAAAEPQWTATLSASAQQAVVGEPVLLTLTIQNRTAAPLALPVPLTWWHPRYAAIRFLQRPPLEMNYDYGHPVTAITETGVWYSKKTYAPGEVVSLSRTVVNGNAGQCAVKWVYDCQRIPEEVNMKTRQVETNQDVWRGLIESSTVSWQVVEPTGVDLEAMKAYQAALPRAIRGLILDVWSQQLLEKFPSSTYAGYALLSMGQCIPDPRVFVTDLLSYNDQAQKEPSSVSQMSADKKRSLKADQARVDQLTAYLKARPDFSRADCLKLELAGRFAALERYQDVQCLCEELVKTAPESEAGKKAQRLLDYLQDKGWIKK